MLTHNDPYEKAVISPLLHQMVGTPKTDEEQSLFQKISYELEIERLKKELAHYQNLVGDKVDELLALSRAFAIVKRALD